MFTFIKIKEDITSSKEGSNKGKYEISIKEMLVVEAEKDIII